MGRRSDLTNFETAKDVMSPDLQKYHIELLSHNNQKKEFWLCRKRIAQQGIWNDRFLDEAVNFPSPATTFDSLAYIDQLAHNSYFPEDHLDIGSHLMRRWGSDGWPNTYFPQICDQKKEDRILWALQGSNRRASGVSILLKLKQGIFNSIDVVKHFWRLDE